LDYGAVYTQIMSAKAVEDDLRGVLSQFSTAEKKLAEASPRVKPLYAITYDTYENLDFPILRHTFYGRSIEEAEGYVESHKKADTFFRGCAKGSWQDVKCRHAVPVIRKVPLAAIQAGGRKKPSMLKDFPIGKMQLRRGR
jgi:hypothetical protein